MQDLVELLIYAATLDLYRRSNRREVPYLSGKLCSAMLDIVDWQKRPVLARVYEPSEQTI